MDWANITLGIFLIILGTLWFTYQVNKTKKYKKDKSYGQLSTQPSQYIGILILILGGALLFFRAI